MTLAPVEAGKNTKNAADIQQSRPVDEISFPGLLTNGAARLCLPVSRREATLFLSRDPRDRFQRFCYAY